MKPFRNLIRLFSIAFLGLYMASCVNNAYDLKNLSKEAELFENSLSIPIGTATIRLDSVIGGMNMDTSILSVKNGKYVFSYAGNFNLGDISSTLNNFSLVTPSSFQTSVDLFNASTLPSNTPLPYPIPVTDQSYSGTMSIALPSFSTSLINVDSISLKNTYIRLTASSIGLGGNKLSSSAILTFTATGNTADYYINGSKRTTWNLGIGESILVEIRKLRVSGSNNNLTLTPSVRVNVLSAGDVTATALVQTKMNIKAEYPNGIDFLLIWGKVNYSTQGILDPINFDALGKILGDNNVLSIYNPTIVLNTEGNIGVPVQLKLDMSTSNSKTSLTKSLSNTNFLVLPSTSPDVLKRNSFTLDKANGTPELFKINPDKIVLGYQIQSDITSSVNHFISKNSQLNMSYKMDIPLQFGGDLKINLSNTLENPFSKQTDLLKDQDNLEVALILNVKNRIPLALKIDLTALDADSLPLFTVETDTIQAAGSIAANTGFATVESPTETEINLTPDQINLIKKTKMFRIGFVVTGNPNIPFVTIQPTDYMIIKIGGKINGGVLLDFSKSNQ